MHASLIEILRAEKPSAILGSHGLGDESTLIVTRDHLLDVMQWLRDDPRARMEVLIDVTAVDYSEYPAHLRQAVSPIDEDSGNSAAELPRYEVVYHLLSMSRGHRLRIKVLVTEQDPHVPSLCDLWISADYGERETFDMYGLQFDGHPELKRVLLYEEFEGHPLRKDYPQRGYQPLMPMPELVNYEGNDTAH